MSRIYWDTMLFVYLLEGHPQFGNRVARIYEHMALRGDILCTSTFTVGEVLVGPQKKGATQIVEAVKDHFTGGEIELIPFTLGIAEEYSRIRAAFPVLPADAIHLASAAQSRIDLFLTNDRKLLRLNLQGISFIAGLDAKLF
jgi:predicted nucleic acid-binding protein